MENIAFDYFLAPDNTFWKWADQGKVVEWRNGETICYAEDLTNLVYSFQGEVLPTASVILLVLAACRDNWLPEHQGAALLLQIKDDILFSPESEPTGLKQEWDEVAAQALAGMERLAKLPPELRSGYWRAEIIREVTAGAETVYPKAYVIRTAEKLAEFSIRAALYIKSEQAKTVAGPIDSARLLQDLRCLARLAARYPDERALAQKLRTGLLQLPAPAPLSLPALPPADLLQELLADPVTALLGRMTKRMIALLRIPMHFRQSDHQHYGGLSDITNRGQFDKLLLSELAHEDTMLLTRLVNNEALFFHREEPPDHPETSRLIMIDSTIRLWGTARILAISAALACTQQLRKNETAIACTLSGADFAPADLATKQGVLQVLEQLDASLHAVEGIRACLDDSSSDPPGTAMLITADETLATPVFQKWLFTNSTALQFLITVGHQGELGLYTSAAGGLKLLSKASINLDELLSQQQLMPGRRKKERIGTLPAFLNQDQPPLLFPAVHLRKSKTQHHYYDQQVGLLCITETMRLLRWKSNKKGATELLQNVEQAGHYHFVRDDADAFCLFLHNENEKTATVYYFPSPDAEAYRWVLATPPLKPFFAMALQQHQLYISGYVTWTVPDRILTIDCLSGKATGYRESEESRLLFRRKPHSANPSGELNRIPGDKISRFVNNGYTTIIRPKKLFIDAAHRLCLNDLHVEKPEQSSGSMALLQGTGITKAHAELCSEEQPFPDNGQLWLKQFCWKDGSTATVDSRGLLHLKSSDTRLPETTMVLIQGKPLACWAADGALCGNEYFLESHAGLIRERNFYSKYIAPFIQTIVEQAQKA